MQRREATPQGKGQQNKGFEQDGENCSLAAVDRVIGSFLVRVQADPLGKVGRDGVAVALDVTNMAQLQPETAQ